MKNIAAREMFIEWYFSQNECETETINLMKEELIESGDSVWKFEDLLDTCSNIPKNIVQALKYSDYLDDEMRNHKADMDLDDEMRNNKADMEAQDYSTFGRNKI